MRIRSPRWRREDIARLDRDLLPTLRDVPEIGDHAGPVAVNRVEQDRIIPSVRALCDAGIVDIDEARAIALAEGARIVCALERQALRRTNPQRCLDDALTWRLGWTSNEIKKQR